MKHRGDCVEHRRRRRAVLEPLLARAHDHRADAHKALPRHRNDHATLLLLFIVFLLVLPLFLLLLPHASGVRRTEVLRTIVLLLGHRFPKVRKATADQLYVHLITFGDLGELDPIPRADDEELLIEEVDKSMEAGDERHEFVMSVLMETAWLDDLEGHAKPARAKLLDAYGLPPPKVTAGVVSVAKPKDEDTYMELVAEAGY